MAGDVGGGFGQMLQQRMQQAVVTPFDTLLSGNGGIGQLMGGVGKDPIMNSPPPASAPVISPGSDADPEYNTLRKGNIDDVAPPAQAPQAPAPKSNSLAALIVETANAVGADPLDLATVISYETGGTFDPRKKGPVTQWGQHQGLIQFGQPQQKRFGVDLSSYDSALRSQLGANGAIVKYLKASGFKPGMSGMDLYSTINAGAPGRFGASDANNGGAAGNVADKWNNQMSGHRKKAQAILGGSYTPSAHAEERGRDTSGALIAPAGPSLLDDVKLKAPQVATSPAAGGGGGGGGMSGGSSVQSSSGGGVQDDSNQFISAANQHNMSLRQRLEARRQERMAQVKSRAMGVPARG